jgi:hypothetical protein
MRPISPASAAPAYSLLQLVSYFLRLASLGFGGASLCVDG